MSYTIGSDPEFFVRHKESRQFVPAFTLIPDATKLNPRSIGDGYGVMFDNVLIEGNIPPAQSKYEFVTNMKTLVNKLNKLLEPFNCEVHKSGIEHFDPEQLKAIEAQEFGCMPFVNAWTTSEEEAPYIAENYRPAGNHIHVGYTNTTKYPTEIVNLAIARMYDFFVVRPANEHHKDELRDRSLYGGFGKFRPKIYGLELRSLSGYFTRDDYLEWIYDQTTRTLDFVLTHEEFIRPILTLNEESINAEDTLEQFGLTREELSVKTTRKYA